MQVNLRELIQDTEPVKFLHVDWRAPRSRLGILYYSLNGDEREIALRVDFDKKAVADEIEDVVVATAVARHITEICYTVMQVQSRSEFESAPRQDLATLSYLGG